MGMIFDLVCAVCGGPAPARKQWWNRDTGFGVCPGCFVLVTEKQGLEEAVLCFGHPDVHHSLVDGRSRVAKRRKADA
jgi:hypothetical protein